MIEILFTADFCYIYSFATCGSFTVKKEIAIDLHI